MKRLREALAFLADYPEGAPILQGDLRGKPLRDYPMSLYYRIVRGHVRVLSIVDQRREPDSESI